MINFGITGPEMIESLGINAKMNEFQAAMGLALLDELDANMQAREAISRRYEGALRGHVQLQARNPNASNNYAYVPVLFGSEADVERAQAALESLDMQTRRCSTRRGQRGDLPPICQSRLEKRGAARPLPTDLCRTSRCGRRAEL